jgi:hypothetical protein
MKKLSLEEQRELMRCREEGYRLGKETQALEASQQSEAEKWRAFDRLMEGVDAKRLAHLSTFMSLENDGLVLAQRRFMAIRALQ